MGASGWVADYVTKKVGFFKVQITVSAFKESLPEEIIANNQ